MKIARFIVAVVPAILTPLGLAFASPSEVQTVLASPEGKYGRSCALPWVYTLSCCHSPTSRGNGVQGVEWLVANNVTHHSAGRESYLVMPVARR